MERILVADDLPTVRTTLRGWLQRRHFQVVTAATSEEAPAAATTLPDFALLDSTLPDLSGGGVLRPLRRSAAPSRLGVVTPAARDPRGLTALCHLERSLAILYRDLAGAGEARRPLRALEALES